MRREVQAVVDANSRAVSGTALARDRTLPLVASLVGLFPEGGLRRGSTVVLARGAHPGVTSLALNLLGGPVAGGSWCAVVGAPDLGLVAAAQLGIGLERLALVPRPGAEWAVVTAALLEGFDVVLLFAPSPVNQAGASKLEARARERGSVLAVVAESWPGRADMRLEVVTCRRLGLGDGFGYLAGCEIEVVARGRGAASRPRRARLCPGGLPPGPYGAAPPAGREMPRPVPMGGRK
ncbi:MAG: hypothetical protein ACRDZX_09505 [Acidimicrobiales bacterium]